MPFFFTYEEEEAYREGKRDASYGHRDYSKDCRFGDDVDKAYCQGYNDKEEEREREREEERRREEEEEELRHRQHMERELERQREEEMMYYYEQQRQEEITRQMLQDDMIGSDDF